MSCKETTNTCENVVSCGNNSKYIIIIVLYILLAIILGSFAI